VFAFNPLILLEQLANGHNDGLLILFGLLAVVALQRGRVRSRSRWPFCRRSSKHQSLLVAGIVALLIRQRRWRGLVRNHQERRGFGRGVLATPSSATQFALMSTQWQYAEDSLHAALISGAGTLLRMVNRRGSMTICLGPTG
jgi:hypothetical protein